METIVNIKISKAGGNASENSFKYMIVIPNEWANLLDITNEDRDVEQILQEESIVIQRPTENVKGKITKVSIVKVDKNFPQKKKYRIVISPLWAKAIGISKENRQIKMIFNNKKIEVRRWENE